MEIENKKWDAKILEKATLISRGSWLFDTYDLNDGTIIKVAKNLDELLVYYTRHDLNILFNDLICKLYLSKYITISDIVKPLNLYLDKDGFKGYTVPKIEGETLETISHKVKNLKVYGEIFYKLSKRVKLLNENGIVLPYLANTSNIFFNPTTQEFKFIDYDGLQIYLNPSYCYSSIMYLNSNKIFESPKYKISPFTYTPNLDKASLLSLFLEVTLDGSEIFNITDSQDSLVEKRLTYLLHEYGLEYSPLEELIRLAYDKEKDNKDPGPSIREFTNSHRLIRVMNRKGHYRKRFKSIQD